MTILIPVVLGLLTFMARPIGVPVEAPTFAITINHTDPSHLRTTVQYPSTGVSREVCFDIEHERGQVTSCWEPRPPQQVVEIPSDAIVLVGRLYWEDPIKHQSLIMRVVVNVKPREGELE